jgi:hypothetical protein
VVETIDVAGNKIAILGQYLDRTGVDRALNVDVPGFRDDPHRAGGVFNHRTTLEDDVGRDLALRQREGFGRVGRDDLDQTTA